MGFFSNLKNKMTGGAAEVRVNSVQVRRGVASPIRIEATAKADAKVGSVYLLVQAVESCEVKDSDWEGNKHTTETVRGRKTSFETKIHVAGPSAIKNGQTYTWEARLELPTNVNPSFDGSIIDHTWQIQAGLDMTGNDPDSGWVTINVQ